MSDITKRILPVAPYQQWLASGAGDPSTGIINGDILGVYESLGNRLANSVTVESVGGPSIIRFNVVHSIFRNPGPQYETWVGLGHGANRPLPLEVTEVEITQPDLYIQADTIMSWSIHDIAVKDIKIISIATSGFRVTVT